MDADPRRSGRGHRHTRSHVGRTFNRCFGRRVVFEEKADTAQGAGAELLIHARRIPKGEDPCNQWFGIDLLSGDRVDEVLEIASLRPPDVARRVVDAVHFIPGVVATRSVRSGEPEVEFLLVVVVPWQVELALADVHDCGPVAGQTRCQLHRLVGGAACHQEHPVRTKATGCPRQRLLGRDDSIVVWGRAEHGPGLLGESATVLVEIEADHQRPRGHEKLDHQLADQAQSDDTCGVSDLHVTLTHPLEGDRTDGGKGGQLGRDAVGQGHTEIRRHPIDLSVERVLVAGARHQLTGRKLLGPFADLLDDTRERIAQRRIGVKTAHCLLVSSDRSLLLDGIEHLLHLVGAGACFAHQ